MTWTSIDFHANRRPRSMVQGKSSQPLDCMRARSPPQKFTARHTRRLSPHYVQRTAKCLRPHAKLASQMGPFTPRKKSILAEEFFCARYSHNSLPYGEMRSVMLCLRDQKTCFSPPDFEILRSRTAALCRHRKIGPGGSVNTLLRDYGDGQRNTKRPRQRPVLHFAAPITADYR